MSIVAGKEAWRENWEAGRSHIPRQETEGKQEVGETLTLKPVSSSASTLRCYTLPWCHPTNRGKCSDTRAFGNILSQATRVFFFTVCAVKHGQRWVMLETGTRARKHVLVDCSLSSHLRTSLSHILKTQTDSSSHLSYTLFGFCFFETVSYYVMLPGLN